MGTPFAVATVFQADDLKRIGRGYYSQGLTSDDGYLKRGWAADTRPSALTDAGKLALELREALGPDRNLTKAGAKALMRGTPTRATKTRLVEDGLVRHDAFFQLTEDGERVRAILLKYKADV